MKVTEGRVVRKSVKPKGYTLYTNEWKVGRKKGSAILIMFYGKPSNNTTTKKRHSSKKGTRGKRKVTVSDVSSEIIFRYNKTQRKGTEITTLLTPWCRALPGKIAGPQLAMRFPTLCGTPSFVTALSSIYRLPIY